MPSTTALPGMITATSSASVVIERAGPNLWWALFASADVGTSKLRNTVDAMPSAIASPAAGHTLARIELDSCGTWVTIANAERSRPIVVRRAGWVDVRGHPHDGPLLDDRVGLGPGDCIVVARPADAATDGDEVLDALLHAPCDVDALLDATRQVCGGDTAIVVLGVPGELGDDPRQRVADATGIAVDDLVLPGYPLGDLQHELWKEPPRPPRLARIRLLPHHRSVRDVRALLDRLISSWRLSDRVDETSLKLAAAEVATNALMHSKAPESVTVRYLGGFVRIEVDDHSDTIPVMRAAADDEIGGRGLHVVDSIAARWGVDPRPDGKRVWFEVEVAPG